MRSLPSRCTGAAAALLLATAFVVEGASAQVLRNAYDFDHPVGQDETFLVSEVTTYAGIVPYIRYHAESGILDGTLTFHWKDKNGATLASGSFSPGLIFDGLGAQSTDFGVGWSRRLAFVGSTIRQGAGTVDFTGTTSRVNGSCVGRVTRCTPADYLYEDNAFAPPAPAPGPVIASTESRVDMSRVIPATDTTPEQESLSPLLLFSTRVEIEGDAYRYTYLVSNETDAAVAFQWESASLGGTLEARESRLQTFLSTALPVTRQTFATATLEFGSFGGTVDLLSPVPEPATVASLAAGLACLGWRLRRRVSGGAR